MLDVNSMSFFRDKIDELESVLEYHPILCSIVVIVSALLIFIYDKVVLTLFNVQLFDYFLFREHIANHLTTVKSIYFILPLSCMYFGYCYVRRIFYSRF